MIAPADWSPAEGLRSAPTLLVNPDFYGTLAATRSLGGHGLPVYIAGDRFLAVSRWSRHASRTLTCPPLGEAERFLDWLCAFGEREPGTVLYPTSDDAAYLYSLRREELARSFRIYQPSTETMVRVLDKKRLYSEARAVGFEIPETWFPESDADVARIAREVPMPLLLKPRTQVLTRVPSKGIVVNEPENLVTRYREFVRNSRYGAALLDRVPDAAQAMIQRYLPHAADQIYVLAAFVDEGGSLFAARSGMKIFQRPRRLGIGLCFEDAPLHADLCERARALARATGYFGLFQLEFVKDGDRFLLIDYNPRFYNQLAFDVARGLPLPRIVHAAACGATDELARLVRAAEAPPVDCRLVYCNEFGMNLVVGAQRLAGRMSASEAERWRLWRESHRGCVIDPTSVSDDTFPALIDALTQIYGHVRHPRAFLHQIVQDRTPSRSTLGWRSWRGSA